MKSLHLVAPHRFVAPRCLVVTCVLAFPLCGFAADPAPTGGVGKPPAVDPPKLENSARRGPQNTIVGKPILRRLNPASLSLESSVHRRPSKVIQARGPKPPPPQGPKIKAEKEIPSERGWKRVVLDTPGLIRAARNRGETEKLASRGVVSPVGNSESVRLKSGKKHPEDAVLTLEPIPVSPNTVFQFRVKCSGDVRLQIAEYDEEGVMIGRQWTNPVYLEKGRGANYSVQTTEWTHWVVVVVDNPGFEETALDSIYLHLGDRQMIKGGNRSE